MSDKEPKEDAIINDDDIIIQMIEKPAFDAKCAELEKWKAMAEELANELKTARNQLEGVSLAFKAHGNELNEGFMIYEYQNMADDKDIVLQEYESFKKDLNK